MKTFYLEVPIYNVVVKVSIGDTGISEDKNACLVIYEDGGYWIRIRKKTRNVEFISTLSHEMLHLVFVIMDRAGAKLTWESQESYAYLQGYLTEQILQRCK